MPWTFVNYEPGPLSVRCFQGGQWYLCNVDKSHFFVHVRGWTHLTFDTQFNPSQLWRRPIFFFVWKMWFWNKVGPTFVFRNSYICYLPLRRASSTELLIQHYICFLRLTKSDSSFPTFLWVCFAFLTFPWYFMMHWIPTNNDVWTGIVDVVNGPFTVSELI